MSQGLVLRAGEDAGMPGVDVGDVAVTDARDRLPGEEATGTRHGRVLYEEGTVLFNDAERDVAPW